MANRLNWESTEIESAPEEFAPPLAMGESETSRQSFGERFMDALAHHRVGAPIATVIFAETLFRLLPNARLDSAVAFVCAVSMLGLAGSIAAMGKRSWGARFARCWLWLLALCSLGFSFSNRTLYGIPAHQAAGLFFVGAVVCALIAESLRIASKRWAIIGEPALYWLAKPLPWTPGVVPREYRFLSRWTVKWDVAVGWLTIATVIGVPTSLAVTYGAQFESLIFALLVALVAIPIAIAVIRDSDAGRGFAVAGTALLCAMWAMGALVVTSYARIGPFDLFLNFAGNSLVLYLLSRLTLRLASVVYAYRPPPKFQP